MLSEYHNAYVLGTPASSSGVPFFSKRGIFFPGPIFCLVTSAIEHYE